MSEALTNSEFQQLLASVEASQELKDEVGIDKPGASLWDAFVGSVRRWFGWDRNSITILDLALRHAENVLTADGRELLTRAPSGTEMSLLKTSDFKDGMDDRLAATSLNVSRWGKAVQTIDQIVRGARSFFEGRPARRPARRARRHGQAGDRRRALPPCVSPPSGSSSTRKNKEAAVTCRQPRHAGSAQRHRPAQAQ